MSGIEGLLLGRVLGDRYRIEEVIGRGGMGAVYRAVDERLGRQVAVKVITVAGGTDAEARERVRARFQREARAAAGLPHHPNVVPVYDYGSDPALGLDYLVMELLRGSDLANYLARSGPPPLGTALRILHEATSGLAVGHRAGLIHRDVKPGNIFLADVGEGEIQIRMVDFGIAKLVDDEDTASQLTQDGRTPHSPAFASPEQLRGLGNLTPASDVFSMGAVGFQLLTGQRAFTESDRNRMSLGMPVDVPAMRDDNPAIPVAVETIVRKALSFDPADRYPDAIAMAGALDQALRSIPDTPIAPYPASLPVPVPPHVLEKDDDRTQAMDGPDDDRTLLAPAPPPPPPPRRQAEAPPRRSAPPPPSRGRRVGSMIVWLLVVAVLGAAAFWVWMDLNPPQSAQVEPIPEPPEEIPEVVLTPEDERVETEVGTEPELDAMVHNQEGRRFLSDGNIEEALRQFELATQLAPEHPDYAYNFGFALRRARQPEEAVRQFERALRLAPNRADVHYHLGLARAEMGDVEGAREALVRAMDLSTDSRQRAAADRALLELNRATMPPPAIVDTITPDIPPPPARRDTARPMRDTIQIRAGQSRPAPRDTIRM